MVLDGIGWNWVLLNGIELFQITIECYRTLKAISGWDGSPGGRRYRAPYGANNPQGAFKGMRNTISLTFFRPRPLSVGPQKDPRKQTPPKNRGAFESRYLLQTVCEELSVPEDHWWRYSRYKQGVALKLKNHFPTKLVHKSAGPIYCWLQKGANVILHFVVADFCLRKSSCPVNLGHVWRLFQECKCWRQQGARNVICYSVTTGGADVLCHHNLPLRGFLLQLVVQVPIKVSCCLPSGGEDCSVGGGFFCCAM